MLDGFFYIHIGAKLVYICCDGKSGRGVCTTGLVIHMITFGGSRNILDEEKRELILLIGRLSGRDSWAHYSEKSGYCPSGPIIIALMTTIRWAISFF